MFCEHCGGNDCGVCRAHGDGHYQTCECEMGEMARLRQVAGKPALRLPGREIYAPHDNSTALSATVVLACVAASMGLLIVKLLQG